MAFKKFVDKIISWNLTSVLISYGKKNSSFAKWNESSDASEAKDCSESEEYSSEVSQSTVDIFSQNTWRRDWGEPLTSRAINHQGTRFQ